MTFPGLLKGTQTFDCLDVLGTAKSPSRKMEDLEPACKSKEYLAQAKGRRRTRRLPVQKGRSHTGLFGATSSDAFSPQRAWNGLELGLTSNGVEQ